MLKKKSRPKINSNVAIRTSRRFGSFANVSHLIAFVLVFVAIGVYFLYKAFAYPIGPYGAYTAQINFNYTGLPAGTVLNFYSPNSSVGTCTTGPNVNFQVPATAAVPCYGYQFGAAGAPTQVGISSAIPAGYSLSSMTVNGTGTVNLPPGPASGLSNTATCGIFGCSFDFSSGTLTVTANFTHNTTTTTTPPSGGSSGSCPYGSGNFGCYTSQVVIKTTGLPASTPVTFYAATPGESIGNCPTDFTITGSGTCSGYQFGAAGSPADLGIQTLPAGYTLGGATPASQSLPAGPAASTGLTNTATCPSGGALGCALSFSNGVATITFNFVAKTSQSPAPSSGGGSGSTTTTSSSAPYGSGSFGPYTSQVVIKTTGLPASTPVTFYAATPGESIGNCPTDFTITGSGTCSGYQFGAAGSPADLGIQTLPAGYTLGGATPASQSLPAGPAASTGLTNTATCPSGGALGCALSFSNGVATITFNFVAKTSQSPAPSSGGGSGSCPYGSGGFGCYTSQVVINVQGVSTVNLKTANESLGDCGQSFTVTGTKTCHGYQFGANAAGGGGVQLDLNGGVPGGNTLTNWSVSPFTYTAIAGSGLSNAAACSNTGCNFDFNSGVSTVTLVFRPSSDTLHAGEDLPTGGSMISANGPFGASSVTVQGAGAGNLVVKTAAGVVLWADKCGSEGDNDYLAMQTDGNLVLYNAEDQSLWADSTTYSGAGANGAYAQIQNDGNFVVHNGFVAWGSNSAPSCAKASTGGGGGGGGSGSNITPAVVADFSAGNNQKSAFDFFVANGYTTAGAAGLVGNMIQESNVNPSVINGLGCEGIVQWCGGRRSNMERYVAALGLPVSSLQGQLEFTNYELNTSYGSVYNDVRTDTSVNNATTVVFDVYEDPGDNSLGAREANAQTVYSRYQFDNVAFVPATPGVSKQAGFADVIKPHNSVGKK